MSKETFEAMDAAIRAHIVADTDGEAFPTGWILAYAGVAASTSEGSRLGYIDSKLPLHEAWGLAHYSTQHLNLFNQAVEDD